jgi:hypothetical protein
MHHSNNVLITVFSAGKGMPGNVMSLLLTIVNG